MRDSASILFVIEARFRDVWSLLSKHSCLIIKKNVEIYKLVPEAS